MKLRLVTLLVLFSAITANASDKRPLTEPSDARDQKRRGTGDGDAPTAKPAPKQDEVENKCAICLTNMNPGETLGTLACKHSFHTTCIQTWFNISNTCPTCRAVEPGVALPAPAVPAPVGTPEIIIAARYGNLVQVQALIAAGANVNIQSISGHTPLIIAAYHGYTEIVQALIAADANVNTANNAGDTPLIIAATTNCHTEIVQALILAGANVNTANNAGNTALIIATTRGDTANAQALIAADADVNAGDNEGYTPLIIAAAHGYTEIAQALIAAGAEVNAANLNGITPLMFAARAGHTAIVEQLITHPGINVTSKNIQDKNAADVAASPEIRALIQAHIDEQSALAVAALTTTTE